MCTSYFGLVGKPLFVEVLLTPLKQRAIFQIKSFCGTDFEAQIPEWDVMPCFSKCHTEDWIRLNEIFWENTLNQSSS